jgi:hypothetical protein
MRVWTASGVIVSATTYPLLATVITLIPAA